MHTEPIEFCMDGIVLRGKLTRPSRDAQQFPLLILLHGLTGNMDEHHISALAETAAECGYGVLRYDQFGHGTSGGDFRRHDILLWMRHAAEVIRIAQAWPFVSWICLGGHSQGGLTAILAGGLMQDRLRALLPLSAAINLHYGAVKGDFLGTPFDAEHPPEWMPCKEEVLSGDYFRTAAILPVEQAIRRFRKPVLLVHGTADETVPYACSEMLLNMYADAELVPVFGDDHSFHHHCSELTAAVRPFLLRLLAEE